jgi:hypothetical protein
LFHKESFGKTVKYLDTSLIIPILSIITTPNLWYISQGDTLWVLLCTLLWGIGVFMVFHPSIKFLFPFLLTKMGIFALTSILAIISILLNSILITLLLPIEYLNNISIGRISLFVLFYIITATTTIAYIHMDNYTQKKPIRYLFSISEYYIEIIFISIFPIAILFWTDITYSFRIFLGILSIGVGIGIFILKMKIEKLEQTILLSLLSAIAILVIDGAVIHLLGINTLETQNIDNHSFQLSSSTNSDDIIVYQILVSIPQIGLQIGHKVASIPNRYITIEATESQYTIYDQYNDKVLLTLER